MAFDLPVYMDNHAATRVDPRVVKAMLPFFTETFGNAGSSTHEFGKKAKSAVNEAREKIAAAVGAKARNVIFTSGATESNNLAIRGFIEKARDKSPNKRRIVTTAIEHPSVLVPLEKLERRGYEIVRLPVAKNGRPNAGVVDVEAVKDSLDDDVVLVSVMAANNEIGSIQPVAEIGRLCRERGVVFHCDAVQAVGKSPVDVEAWNVDLMSFTAHKIYGPKGVGALYVRRGESAVALESQIDGGGQESSLRSGTTNVPGIVGFAEAIQLAVADLVATKSGAESEVERILRMRDLLFERLSTVVEGVSLNGPSLTEPGRRLPGNLNVRFENMDGETLLMKAPDVAASTGSACASADPAPSHVLAAIGLNESEIRSSVRFGLGRFNTEEEIDYVVSHLSEAIRQLRSHVTLN